MWFDIFHGLIVWLCFEQCVYVVIKINSLIFICIFICRVIKFVCCRFNTDLRKSIDDNMVVNEDRLGILGHVVCKTVLTLLKGDTNKAFKILELKIQ